MPDMELYDYGKLEEARASGIAAMQGGSGDEEAIKLGMAAAYALDLVDIAKDNGVELDLTSDTEDNVQKAIVLTHKDNVDSRKSSTKSKENIAKKFGSYELFTLYNGLAASGVDARIALDGSNVKLFAVGDGGNEESFDVLRRAEEVIGRFKLSSPGSEFSVVGTLQPFYERLMKDFLSRL